MNNNFNNKELEKENPWKKDRLAEFDIPRKHRGYQPPFDPDPSSGEPPTGGSSAKKPDEKE